ncbi:unnamed protein product [marine sediment metagenome]|uniref:Uncharacterized protein n=1 Tax=marine sediment metagenome TaxID=412755 RepID=X1H3E7_9ZZZZ
MTNHLLKHAREQVKKHSFGKLVFLSSIGPRAWGFAPDDVDYDYQGIYASKEDNTYQVFVSGAGVNNYNRDITLIDLERIIVRILRSDVYYLVFINSPVIYASKEFLEFKKWGKFQYLQTGLLDPYNKITGLLGPYNKISGEY